MILELRPIHFSFAVCGFYQYNVCREREDFERDSQPECKCQKQILRLRRRMTTKRQQEKGK
jgi:hypothetical protein